MIREDNGHSKTPGELETISSDPPRMLGVH